MPVPTSSTATPSVRGPRATRSASRSTTSSAPAPTRATSPAFSALWRAGAASGDLYKQHYEGRLLRRLRAVLPPDELTSTGAARSTDKSSRSPRRTGSSGCRATRTAARLDRLGRAPDRPAAVRNEVLAFVRARPRRLQRLALAARASGWGVPVPDDPDQVIYVWFDALTNYITALGYGADAPRLPPLVDRRRRARPRHRQGHRCASTPSTGRRSCSAGRAAADADAGARLPDPAGASRSKSTGTGRPRSRRPHLRHRRAALVVRPRRRRDHRHRLHRRRQRLRRRPRAAQRAPAQLRPAAAFPRRPRRSLAQVEATLLGGYGRRGCRPSLSLVPAAAPPALVGLLAAVDPAAAGSSGLHRARPGRGRPGPAVSPLQPGRWPPAGPSSGRGRRGHDAGPPARVILDQPLLRSAAPPWRQVGRRCANVPGRPRSARTRRGHQLGGRRLGHEEPPTRPHSTSGGRPGRRLLAGAGAAPRWASRPEGLPPPRITATCRPAAPAETPPPPAAPRGRASGRHDEPATRRSWSYQAPGRGRPGWRWRSRRRTGAAVGPAGRPSPDFHPGGRLRPARLAGVAGDVAVEPTDVNPYPPRR